MDPLTALGIVSNIVQIVDLGINLVSKTKDAYRSGKAVLVGAPALEAATVDLKHLSYKLEMNALSTGDLQMQALCVSSATVSEKLLKALGSVSTGTKSQLWASFRKALKTVMSKADIEELEKRLADIRQQLNLRIATDIQSSVAQYGLKHSGQLTQLDSTSKRILDAIVKQQDVFKVETGVNRTVLTLLQRQEHHANSAEQEKHLARLPNVPQAAYNSIERQHDPLCLQHTRVDVLRMINDWKDGPKEKHIFWLCGLAGTGKSTISATIARNHDNITASFFFSRGGGETGRAQKLFTSIAVQLAHQNPVLRGHICDAIEESSNISSLSLYDQWRFLVLSPLQKLDDRFHETSLLLILDALDECDDELDIAAIIQIAAEARSIRTIRVRIFITSRPDVPIRHGFYDLADADYTDLVLHEIAVEMVANDIKVFLEHNFAQIRRGGSLPPDWPGRSIIEQLIEKSAGLFIWAATACRFIREGKRFTKARLATILKGGTSSTAPEQKLDNIYTTVLENSISDDFTEDEKESMYEILREILGSLVVLSSPLTTQSLANLLQIPKDELEESLMDLHAILDLHKKRPIRIHHPSFRDFLLRKERCTNQAFWVSEIAANTLLVRKCVEIMSKSLQKDICELGDHYGIPTAEIAPETIIRCVTEDVQYACHYWTQHLQKSDIVLQDNDFIHLFLKDHFLHWLETLGLTGKISEVVLAITRLESRVSSKECPELSAFIYDAKRFVLYSRSVIENSPLQTYCSALVFAPKQSIIRQQFVRDIPSWIDLLPSTPENWGASLQVLEGHTNWVRDIAFSPDGQYLASAASDRTVRIWDPVSGATLQTLNGHSDIVYGVAFSCDNVLASGSSDRTIRLWNSSSGALLHELKGHQSGVRAVAFSPDGKTLASSAADKTLKLWDWKSEKVLRTLAGHTEWVYAIDFSRQGKLASASADRTVRLWDLSSGTTLVTIEGYSNAVRSVAFSPNGEHLAAVTSDKNVWLWSSDAQNGKLRRLEGHTDWVYGVAFAPNGKQIASVSADMSVRLWDVHTRSAMQTLDGHTDWLYAAAYSPDGKLLASAGADKSIRLWDVTSVPLPPVRGHHTLIHAAISSSDGRLLASAADEDNTVRVWNAESGLNELELQGHQDWIYSFAFSPDGKILASASEDTSVRLWDTGSGTQLALLMGHSKTVRGLTFSFDGDFLASTSDDKSAIIWQRTSTLYEKSHVLSGHDESVRAAAFSPQNMIFATGSDDTTARLWKIDGDEPKTIKVFRGHRISVRAVAFSPDGSLVASASAGGVVDIWTVESGHILQCLSLSDFDHLRSILFSAQGPFLETDKGLLPISCYTPPARLGQTSEIPRFFLKSNWVTRNGENMLWLPPQYRATRSSFQNQIFGLGHSSGLVTFMKFA